MWQHDGDLAETYGLEPNYGCCTANFHQGWPKFANSLFFTAADGGVVVAMYAPASATLPGGATVSVDTSYPFGDGATVTVTSAKGESPPVKAFASLPLATRDSRLIDCNV